MTPDGLTVERSFQPGKVPARIILPNGQMAKRDLAAEIRSLTVAIPVRHQAAKGWPMKPCVGSGVHASQAGELREHFKEAGVSTEVTPDGDPIYTSPQHRKRALKCRGMYDRDSF